MGLALPDWCSWEDYQGLAKIANIFYDVLTLTEEMRRTLVGPVIAEILKNIKNKEDTYDKRKIYFFSGHDVNIASFQRVHNFTNAPELPDFGSTFIIEKLRGKKDGQVYIRVSVLVYCSY